MTFLTPIILGSSFIQHSSMVVLIGFLGVELLVRYRKGCAPQSVTDAMRRLLFALILFALWIFIEFFTAVESWKFHFFVYFALALGVAFAVRNVAVNNVQISPYYIRAFVLFVTLGFVANVLYSVYSIPAARLWGALFDLGGVLVLYFVIVFLAKATQCSIES